MERRKSIETYDLSEPCPLLCCMSGARSLIEIKAQTESVVVAFCLAVDLKTHSPSPREDVCDHASRTPLRRRNKERG